MSLGDFENLFIKVGDSETKEGLRVEGATGESLGGALLWLFSNIIRKSEPRQGCCWLTGRQRKRALEMGLGGKPGTSW